MEPCTAFRSIPKPLVAFPWGSRSTTSVRMPLRASTLARFTTVVVLPTPPFWFAQAIVRATQRPARNTLTERDSTIDGSWAGSIERCRDRVDKGDTRRIAADHPWVPSTHGTPRSTPVARETALVPPGHCPDREPVGYSATTLPPPSIEGEPGSRAANQRLIAEGSCIS